MKVARVSGHYESIAPSSLRGGLMVCGTTSDAGKSQIVGGLCRVLARRGVRVAPFKAQNMANNSYVTASGHEIGRAQGVQAMAARVTAEVSMNPILLKPESDRLSQVVVRGVSIGSLSAAEYHARKPELLELVLESLTDLRSRFDVVICEGAGSPTEINRLDHDIVNLRIAHEAGFAAIVVGDINPGGVFAALYGTVALLPRRLRDHVSGFIINKFRGDPALLFDGTAQLERACGVATFGVVPWLEGLTLDAEDSMGLTGFGGTICGTFAGDPLDVVVLRLPRISNYTDFDPLCIEPGVSVRFVEHPSALGRPDLVIIPGSKATVADLEWVRRMGFVEAFAKSSAPLLGICAGYQMLGQVIDDPVESGSTVEGLGLLPVQTQFHQDKLTRQTIGRCLGQAVGGYQIHHGRVTRTNDTGENWMTLASATGEPSDEVRCDVGGRMIAGTTMHGLFESDDFRAAFLRDVAARNAKTFVPSGVSFLAAREAQIDRVADALEEHVDLARVFDLVACGPVAHSLAVVGDAQRFESSGNT